MLRTFLPAALALAAAALPAPALAQAANEITDAINQNTRLEDARRAQEDRTLRRVEEEGEGIDGEAGVYVLQVNEIFYVAGGIGGGWAENPLRTVDDEGSSAYADAAVTLGMQTLLGGSVDFGLSATLSGVEYTEDFAPSSRTINGAMTVGTAIGDSPFYVGASVFGGRNFDGDFENGTTFYGTNLFASASGQLGPRTFARATVSGGRVENDISENNAWNAALDAEVSQFLAENFSVAARARVTRTWFDDFFEDVTFVPRNDWQYGGNVSARWAPVEWLSVDASVGYENRDSGFFLSNYDGFEAALRLTARERF